MTKFAALKSSAFLALLCLPLLALAQLPEPLTKALARANIPLDSVSVWVSPAGVNVPVVSHRTQHPMQPASVVKVVTTLASLDLLKPDFTWQTQVRAAAFPDSKGVVRSVALIGTGDPHLMIEQVWLLTEKLRQIGVRKIEGNIIVDRSAFDERVLDPAAFDASPDRSYNVQADAALVNLKSLSITFEPEENGQWARVTALPVLDGYAVPKRVRLSAGSCGDWKKALKARFNASGVRFDGTLPAACGVKALHVARWKSDDYLARLLRPMFRSAGIVWTGTIKEGRVDADFGVRLVQSQSASLPKIVSWVNKYSNNTMARHLFLTLSRTDADGEHKPATLRRSRAVVEGWLKQVAGALPKGTYIDNGSGLSRKTKIAAETLGRVLNYGYNSYVMPEFMASLPLAGYDGTMKKRPLTEGSAHIKTGLIRDVRSIAGYVTDIHARRWSVVVMMNGKKLNNDRLFSQAVLNWCASGGAQALIDADNKRKGQ